MVLTSNGALLIRNVVPDDEGMYICKTEKVYLVVPDKIVTTDAMVTKVYNNTKKDCQETTKFDYVQKRQQISKSLLNHEIIEISPFPSKQIRFSTEAYEHTTTPRNNTLSYYQTNNMRMNTDTLKKLDTIKVFGIFLSFGGL